MHSNKLMTLLALALALGLAACGGATNPDPDPIDPGDPNDPIDPPPRATVYYVDSAAGDDANEGSSDDPFKTITHALDFVIDGDTVRVRPGTYDEASGERFPLIMPEGVVLSGNGILKGRGIVISGSGLYDWGDGATYATIVPRPNSVISGLAFYNYEEKSTAIGGLPVWNAVVAAVRSDAIVRNCTIRAQDFKSYGILFDNGSSGVEIDSCDIRGADYGIGFRRDGGQASIVQGNTIQENWIGVLFAGDSTGGGDLGGGSTGSYGGNTISENERADLAVLGAGLAVDAQRCLFDGCSGPSVFTGGSPPVGIDIWLLSGTTVDVTGARADEFCLDPGF